MSRIDKQKKVSKWYAIPFTVQRLYTTPYCADASRNGTSSENWNVYLCYMHTNTKGYKINERTATIKESRQRDHTRVSILYTNVCHSLTIQMYANQREVEKNKSFSIWRSGADVTINVRKNLMEKGSLWTSRLARLYLLQFIFFGTFTHLCCSSMLFACQFSMSMSLAFRARIVVFG